MMVHPRWSQAFISSIWVVLTVVLWIAFAPTQVGGGAAYILVLGNSMEPGFHLGDLIIVQRASDYGVGDIVAYRNTGLKANVFHRIIGFEHGRYILKGDNNTWIDSDQPAREDIIGRLWIHVPGGGSLVHFLRRPIMMGMLAGALAGLIALVFFTATPKGRRRMKQRTVREWVGRWIGILRLRAGIRRTDTGSGLRLIPAPAVSDDPARIAIQPMNDKPGKLWGVYEILFFMLGLVAFGALILGLVSFSRPATISAPDDVNFQHIGLFSYSASAPAGIYDSNIIRSGQPIFPKLTCTANVNFIYSLLGNSLENMEGTYQMMAQISEPQSGWQRTIPLGAQTSFSGSNFETQTAVNLCQFVAVIDAMEQATEFHASQYLLFITPRFSITGQVEGRDLDSTYEPQLAFRFDRLQFSVVRAEPGADPFNQMQADFIREMHATPNTLPLLGSEPAVGTLRWIAIAGLVLSLTGIWWLGAHIQSITRDKPESMALMKYESMIVDVQSGSINPSPQVMEVLTMDDLAKIAERQNAMIMHQTRGHIHNYLVHMDGLAYFHSVREPKITLESGSFIQLGKELRRGMDHGELQVYYQPIVSLTDGKMTAVEALLRWHHPQRGMIPASEFMPVAETTGLIENLDEWVLQVALRQLKTWQESGMDLKLTVNLSERNIDKNPANFIRQILKTTGANPRSLQIEIPETKVLEDSYTILPRLKELKDLGVNIAIDDYLGGSDVASLGRFPINSVKIDRLFVEKIQEPDGAITIQKIITVAQQMGLEVVAKGVETDEQRTSLNAQAFLQAQGYLLGRPVPAQNIVELFRGQNTLARRPSPDGRSRTKKVKK